MPIGRFIAMVGFLVWRRSDGRYLLLRRSPDKDFAAGEWETGSGRLDQGEGFADAVQRESKEELGVDVRIECILGTTHFYRGEPTPDNDMVGVSFGCSIPDESSLSISAEHSEHRWMTSDEASEFLPPGHWLAALIHRAEVFRQRMPKQLRELHWDGRFESQ